uniref:Unkown protein n=1 Tax=Riptortus pedestris TaxID=329032 RepID=R4WDX6_RIPPE|nr:unkown protein [Riptortus pedestris]
MTQPSNWIHISNNLKRALNIINKIETKKIQLLLNKIVMEMKQNSDTFSIFTDEERHKLSANLLIDENDISLLINACILIFHQAVYHVTNPEKFKAILLEELKLSEEKVQSFFNVWSSNAKSLILKMKQKSVYSTQLEDVSWLMNIEISSQDNQQTFVPKSILQLKLKEDQEISNLHLELGEKELFHLYNTLENIQGALDALS